MSEHCNNCGMPVAFSTGLWRHAYYGRFHEPACDTSITNYPGLEAFPAVDRSGTFPSADYGVSS